MTIGEQLLERLVSAGVPETQIQQELLTFAHQGFYRFPGGDTYGTDPKVAAFNRAFSEYQTGDHSPVEVSEWYRTHRPTLEVNHVQPTVLPADPAPDLDERPKSAAG